MLTNKISTFVTVKTRNADSSFESCLVIFLILDMNASDRVKMCQLMRLYKDYNDSAIGNYFL